MMVFFYFQIDNSYVGGVFNQEPSLVQFSTLWSTVFQSRIFLDAILDPVECYFSIKNLPWCNFGPCGASFFNQEPSLVQFQTLWGIIFQSRTVLGAISDPVGHHFSIKNRPWCNFRPCGVLFFNQEPSLMQFRTLWGIIFQSRTFLDAISDLMELHFSIKNRPWCNFRPCGASFFNQEPSLVQF